MGYRVTILPQQLNIDAVAGENLMKLLLRTGLGVDAPCGGEGRCGKCRVLVDGVEASACQTTVDRDITVTLPDRHGQSILTDGVLLSAAPAQTREGYCLAFDIGTTTVAGYLLQDGKELASASAANPQIAFGGDVISRIRFAARGQSSLLRDSIRNCLNGLTGEMCRTAGILPDQIQLVSVVGNPAMQQFFLGLSTENLARPPFAPLLTDAATVPAGEHLSVCRNAQLLIIPDITGFVGADTVACILATGMDETEDLTLLVDIGTNGEMVLGNRRGMVACSTAAGPALEGASIKFGMRGQAGAIDHVRTENGQIIPGVIGNGPATGICGSGLIDAVAAALQNRLLNERGKILTEDRLIHLTDWIYLTQEDIRQVQLAKGAIAAGIRLMADHMGVTLEDIRSVYLAGAFGTYMDPRSACRIGLLPEELEHKIKAVGNAAGSGAKQLAADADALSRTKKIISNTEALDLSSLPEFPRYFAKNMRFSYGQMDR